MRETRQQKRIKKRGQRWRRMEARGREMPPRCNRCSRFRPLTFVERYGVSLCKRCTFEMDCQTNPPTGPGTYQR